MDRTTSTTIVIAIIVLALVGMLIGWHRRKSRQSALARPDAVPTDSGRELLRVDALYLATTMADDELNRIAVAGLGFRARAIVTVAEAGVILSLAGATEVFIARTSLHAVDRATYVIDRVVETGGLVRLTWSLGATRVDSYLRLTNSADAIALIDAVHSILSTPVPMEGDAK